MSTPKDSGLEKALGDFEKVIGISGPTVNSLNEINAAVLGGGKSMEAMTSTVKTLGSSLGALGDGFGGLIKLVPGIGSVGKALSDIGSSAGSLTSAVGSLGDAFMNVVKAGDAFSYINRELASSNYALAAQFGDTMDESVKFTNFMLGNSKRLAGADFGFQNFESETKVMAEALSKSKISFDRMQESVTSTAGTLDLYSMAVLQSNSMGISAESYAKLMSEAMIDQGMSVQRASETLAMYSDIAKRTGLTVNTISGALSGLGGSFRKMGLDANFGQSFLDGFVKSLSETGIGIENAADLAKTFGSTMANLSTNYSSSFVTAQRGGLDQGSGGALGAGIQMQARLMDPNANQAEVGKELAGAVRDTIASFTGGEIVTVKDAAESRDPRMEQAFVIQSKLLGSMYGINDSTEQARTLELLQKMSEVEATGTEDGMAALGSQLKSALNLRQQTISNEEKLNRLGAAQIAELSLQTQTLGKILMAIGEEELVGSAAGIMEKSFDSVQSFLNSAEGDVSKAYSQYVNKRDAGPDMSSEVASRISELNKGIDSSDKDNKDVKSYSKELSDYFSNSILNFNTDPIVRAISELGDSIRDAIPGITSNPPRPPGAKKAGDQ